MILQVAKPFRTRQYSSVVLSFEQCARFEAAHPNTEERANRQFLLHQEVFERAERPKPVYHPSEKQFIVCDSKRDMQNASSAIAFGIHTDTYTA